MVGGVVEGLAGGVGGLHLVAGLGGRPVVGRGCGVEEGAGCGWGVGGRYVFFKTKLKAWHVRGSSSKLILLAGKHLINMLWLNDFLTDSLTLSYIHI